MTTIPTTAPATSPAPSLAQLTLELARECGALASRLTRLEATPARRK